MEKNGVPLVFAGRSGTNVVGRNEVQVWEKVAAPPKEDKIRKGFREEALALMFLLSVLFVTENVLVRKTISYSRSLCITVITENSCNRLYPSLASLSHGPNAHLPEY